MQVALYGNFVIIKKIKKLYMYFSVPDKKEHFFLKSYKNIYKFFKLDKLIWDGVVIKSITL
uniref:Uncharacterized protein n=1 Tax=viral metagenome TaxID=1070528 RepID=A0A6C0ADL3_9ZZZZ